MALTNHRFCWHGIISTDVDATTPFYAAVLPWSVDVVEMGGDPMTFFQAADGQGRAHTRPPQMDGEPAYWSSYFRVEDVDAAAASAAEHGGTILVPPMDIAPGRFSTVLSPSGAAFNLFHEANESDEDRPDVDGAVHWNELHSTDLAADLAWLQAAFGLTTEEMAMPNGPYTILKSGEVMVGGAMPQAYEGAPSMWLPWVHTQDVDGAVQAAPGAGGAVVAPTWDVPNVGRMAILSDPAGAVFGVIKPSPRG